MNNFLISLTQSPAPEEWKRLGTYLNIDNLGSRIPIHEYSQRHRGIVGSSSVPDAGAAAQTLLIITTGQ